MSTKHTDVIPRDINELLAYRPYIAGGLRNLGVPEPDIEDRMQDVLVHCMASNFFKRVQEKVDAGKMTPKKFRAYLGATVHNLVVNEIKRLNRDPSVGALSADLSDGDSTEDYKGTINLSRYQNEAEASTPVSLPANVIEKDIIKYVSERKPAFIPTLILWMQDYRPSDIARIIGKKKETIHYRMKAIFKILEEYFENKGQPLRADRKISQPTPKITGPTYEIKGENPFRWGSSFHIWQTLKACGRPVTKTELMSITQRLLEQGMFKSSRTAEQVAETFIASALDKGNLSEYPAPASSPGSGGRSNQGGPRTHYRLTTTENPYKWGSGRKIFDDIKRLTDFDFNTVASVVQANLDANQIQSRRSPEEIAWGFIETARGYQVLEKLAATDDADDATVPTVAVDPVPVSRLQKKHRFIRSCVFTRGLNFRLWQELLKLDAWSILDAIEIMTRLMASGEISSKRPPDQLADSFYYTLYGKYRDHYEDVNPGV